ncbi:MAG: hypothetical protein ACYCZ6_17225 [Polaromonas sp.]
MTISTSTSIGKERLRKHEIDVGMREGVTSEERDRIKALEREVNRLRVGCAGAGFV